MAARDFAISKVPDVVGFSIVGRTMASLNYGVIRVSDAAVEATDSTPPTISNITPAPGEIPGMTRKQRAETPIQFDVTDTGSGASGLRKVAVWVQIAGIPGKAMAYDGDDLIYPFSGAQSSVTTITGGKRFSIRPVEGWSGDIAELSVVAIDQAGNEDVQS